MMPTDRPISLKDLMNLVGAEQSPKISIYLPTSPSSDDCQESRILLKNLTARVDEKLHEKGLEWRESLKLLSRANALIDNDEFWEHQSEGLAIFINAEKFQMFKLPIDVPVLDFVSDRFHVTPLLRLLDNDLNFYVLALCENGVRLFDATKYTFDKADIEGLPNSMADTIWQSNPEKQKLWKDGTTTPPHDLDPSKFCLGSRTDAQLKEHESDITKYYQLVNKALTETFTHFPAPIVLSSNQYLSTIYRSVNTAADLLPQGVITTSNETAFSVIHKSAWEFAVLHSEKSDRDFKETFQAALDNGTASFNPTEIAAAAEDSRIETLFVSLGDSISTPSGLKSTKINLAALATLTTGGEVHPLEPSEMTLNLPLAATFRN